ncbi:ALP1-like protein isoform X1 [Tanacetum coccineum]
MPKYLRKPTLEDVVKIQQKHNNVHGFPGMLGSIDCMHWEWKNCPVSWQGQYGRGDKKYPTIMLEAVASQDLWIWHAFYGMADANNDINVLDNSPLFDDLLDDLAPVVPYVVNGVLQGRWGLIQQPARAYEVNTLRRIMYAGIIMHNMILEDQNMSVVDFKHVYSNPARSMQTIWIDRCETQRRKAKELRDRDTHISLQQNLMNHIWREVKEASEED